MKIAQLALLAATISAPLAASAQDAGVETRFYDFNDMLIDGEFQRPEGMFATERGRAQFNSLLNIRRSFIQDIKDAADEDVLQ